MKLTKTYTSDDGVKFNAGTEISINSVVDNYSEKICSVSIYFFSESVEAVRDVGSFTYDETWHDEDVINFLKTIISFV